MSVWTPHLHVMQWHAGWRARGRFWCICFTWLICCVRHAVVAQVLYGTHEPLAVAQAGYCQINLQHTLPIVRHLLVRSYRYYTVNRTKPQMMQRGHAHIHKVRQSGEWVCEGAD